MTEAIQKRIDAARADIANDLRTFFPASFRIQKKFSRKDFVNRSVTIGQSVLCENTKIVEIPSCRYYIRAILPPDVPIDGALPFVLSLVKDGEVANFQYDMNKIGIELSHVYGSCRLELNITE